MSAPVRVPADRITAALQATGGNVSASAASAGMSANALRKRLPGLGVDLGGLRAQARATAPRSVRVSSELFERLRDAKFDLQHRLRRELDEGDVLALFVDEAFEAWLTRKLS